MVKKSTWIKGAALVLCAALVQGQTAVAEEKRLGDFVYVPASQATAAAGAISLRVEGLALSADSDEAQVVETLAGAEFGVYVFSGTGELTPWANPLYPSEPMRIRTGEGETRFSLPQGTEFYLRQERAPQGYLFDDEALIRVEGEEIVVQNRMAGQLVVAATDTLGEPIPGVELEAVGEDGTRRIMTTDADGEAVLLSDKQQRYTIRETQRPEGVFAALSVSGGEAADGGVQAEVSPAQRTRVTFEHPAAGTVQLDVQVAVIDEHAQTALHPLEGVRMELLGDPAMTLVTDEQGQARASLMEGTYGVRLSYAGEEAVVLPVSEGQMIVESGSTTLIELEATETTGRIELTADCEGRVEQGGVTLIREETGERFGPYAMDAEGTAVSDALEAGVYRVESVTLAEGMVLGGAQSDGVRVQDAGELALEVRAGQVTRAELSLLTREKQRFGLACTGIDEQGETVLETLEAALTLTLVNEQGEAVAQVEAAQGGVDVEALRGVYTLRMNEGDAARWGVRRDSQAFELPSREESVVFASESTRVILTSVDENGDPAPGAVYQMTDSAGTRHEVACDADGMAVSPLLAAGEVTVETLDAPEGYADAAACTMTANPGEAAHLSMVHAHHGSAAIRVQMQSLSESGAAVYAPLAGAQIHILRASEDGGLTDTGMVLTADADGRAQMALPEGAYAAMIEERTLDLGCRAPAAVRFDVENTKQTEASLVCMDDKGGVRVRLTGGVLTDDELAQVRFELTDADGTVIEMALQDGAFYAGGLAAGEYRLHQTQLPAGYTLLGDRSVQTAGGEVTELSVPLEEYAVLSVSKTGLTFDSEMRTYVVPLSGQYGVYVMQDGEMKPYPHAANPMTLWANVTAEEAAQGRYASVKLPAAVEGTTYYLHELGSAEGFAADDTYYEVTLHAGEAQTLSCAVSSDRGFFALEAVDAATGAHVTGGVYELVNSQTGEVVLTFEMGEAAYQNAMAVPVGAYVLRQSKAAPGYALSEPAQTSISVEPYLTQGGHMTSVQMRAAALPQSERIDVIEAIYAGRQQGLTILTVETGAWTGAQALRMPQVTIDVGAAGGERADVAGVVLSGAGDAAGSAYRARVEYCLAGGGWQPSDARETGVLAGPTAVSLNDVRDDIRAIRVTYIHDETGEEAAGLGFTPGQISLNLEASAQGGVQMQADVRFEGLFAYRTALDGEVKRLPLSDEAAYAFEMEADGLFETVSAGRDGRVTGVAFFDEDADGVMDAQETNRYAGMTVSLQTLGGDVVASARTDADGRYAFDSISGGEYRVVFDAGSGVVFSRGQGQSSHLVSAVEDKRFGTSAALRIDGDHTDYVVNVGCIYAAEIDGVVLERVESGEAVGFAGLNIEMRALEAGADDEPVVVLTGGMGEFTFSRILPGAYEVTIHIPDGYLCTAAKDGRIVRTVELGAGDVHDFGVIELEKSVSIRGRVRVDEDGDGVIQQGAQTLEGVRVVLLGVSDGHTEPIAETVTDANGRYAFEAQRAGEYSVLFELEGAWSFTRFGEDSDVYGAVSQSGATRTFSMQPGESAEMDAGVAIPARLTVNVFCDTQYDGQKGVYEEGLPEAVITLIRQENGADAEKVAMTTDASGMALFEGVSPGEYVIEYQLPGQWRATRQIPQEQSSHPVSFVPQSTSPSGRSERFTLGMGGEEERFIGAMLSGAIAGEVYYDDDADANRDEGEAACTAAWVELVNADGETVAKVQPDERGSYQFEGLAPGRYTVRFTAEDGCGFSGTERTVARGGVQESETNVSGTRVITVESGKTAASSHAGVVRLTAVSGRVWEDRNGDRSMDAGEMPMSGLAVHLMDGAGRNILSSTETDADGGFAFDHLKPGTYKLRVDAREAYVFSGAQKGSALPLEQERDGRGYSQAFTLLGGARAENIAYGLLTQGEISGLVWNDENFSGAMDETEAGLRGVQVTLLNEQGDEVASRQTARSGEFVFDELMPGRYVLRVTLPEGYLYTAEGGESRASRTGTVETELPLGDLPMGGAMTDVRIGALQASTLGGVAWVDQNDDGRRGNDEAVLPGAKATLTMMSGADAGAVLETVTDEKGAYRFERVTPGEAVLSFALPDGYAFARQVNGTRGVSCVPMEDASAATTDVLTVSAGELRTTLDVGAVGVGTISGCVWEDAAYDGRMGADESGIGGALVEMMDAVTGETLRAVESAADGRYEMHFVRRGEYALRVTLPNGRIFTRSGESRIEQTDSDTAQTERFALDMGESLTDVRIGAILPAGMEGRMAVDQDGDGACGADEPGFAGATVLAMQGGTVAATAYTDETGAFRFDMLRPGTYRLRYVLDDSAFFALGAALHMTDADALEGETGEVTLAMGERAQAADVPVVLAGRMAGRAFEDADVSGAQDGGELPLIGVKAELLDEGGAVLAQTETDGEGRYAFERLRGGAYRLRFTLEDAMLFTDDTGRAGDSCVPVPEGSVGETNPIALSMGEEKSDLNVGGIRPGKIGDTVWHDLNGNGLQDYREPLLSGVKLTLLYLNADGTMTEAASTQSDRFGYYAFEALRPGSYVLRLDAREGDVLTAHFGEPLGEIDSDLDPETGMSAPIALRSGQTLLNVDVGLTDAAP